jgi:hypothetical protein
MPSLRLGPCILLVGASWVLSAAAGCSKPPPVEVSGTIKLGGKEPNLKGLQIVFLAEDGGLFSATVSENGTYTAPGVPVGELRVGFVFAPADGSQRKPKHRFIPKEGETHAEGPSTSWNPIPESLREATTSGITFVVEAGKNNLFDYDVPVRQE